MKKNHKPKETSEKKSHFYEIGINGKKCKSTPVPSIGRSHEMLYQMKRRRPATQYSSKKVFKKLEEFHKHIRRERLPTTLNIQYCL